MRMNWLKLALYEIGCADGPILAKDLYGRVQVAESRAGSGSEKSLYNSVCEEVADWSRLGLVKHRTDRNGKKRREFVLTPLGLSICRSEDPVKTWALLSTAKKF